MKIEIIRGISLKCYTALAIELRDQPPKVTPAYQYTVRGNIQQVGLIIT